MRSVIAIVLLIFSLSAPTVSAAPLADSEFRTQDEILFWMKSYRTKPAPTRLPGVVGTLARLGAFQEPDAAGIYVGFIAGVLHDNPKNAPKFIDRMTAIPPEDHWIIVRAIAYSGLPNWSALLGRFAPKMPSKNVMIEAFGTGQLPILSQFEIPQKESRWDRIKSSMPFRKKAPERTVLEPSPAVLDTLWGYYFATGDRWPLDQMIALLPWSDDRNDAGRLTIGSSTKYALARYAARDVKLLGTIKDMRPGVDEKTGPILDEVIFAAETVEVGKIREEATAAINELRAKGPAYKRKIAWWGQLGEGAISLGCVVAAVSGAAALGVPCVVGGALTSATLRYFAREG
jgi:hypothetical protein